MRLSKGSSCSPFPSCAYCQNIPAEKIRFSTASIYAVTALIEVSEVLSINQFFLMRLHGKIQLNLYDLSCVDQALSYIKKHYRDAISIEQLSMEIGMGIKKLRAGIKLKTGLTLHEYHFKVRIEQAMPMLSDTGHPLKAIASSVGFKTESHFCKRFKEITSMTPMEYRLQCAV